MSTPRSLSASHLHSFSSAEGAFLSPQGISEMPGTYGPRDSPQLMRAKSGWVNVLAASVGGIVYDVSLQFSSKAPLPRV